MYKNILVATDGSELAGKAVVHALDLAKAVGAHVTAVVVTEPMWNTMPGEMAIAFPYDEYERASGERAQAVLAGVADAAKQHGVGCQGRHVKDQFPAEGIISAAHEAGCDLIVMASHGRRGLAKLMLGSQAMKVVTSSHVPVLIYR